MHGEKRNVYRVLARKPEIKKPLGRPGVGWRVILKWFLEKQDLVVWTGLIWPRMVTCGGLLRTW
jgi:hypothetical protein